MRHLITEPSDGYEATQEDWAEYAEWLSQVEAMEAEFEEANLELIAVDSPF